MSRDRRHFRPRPHVVAQYLGALSSAVLSFALVVTPGGASAKVDTAKSSVSPRVNAAQCNASSVTLNAATNQHRYGVGTSVVMTATIRNVSSSPCSISVGAISPSLSISNAKGAVVWRNCGAMSTLGACPLYLMLKDLEPGTSYVRTATWNHHAGHSTSRVPAGSYQLNVQFNGVGLSASSTFQLAPSARPRTVTATTADSGRSFTLHIGDHFIVELSGPSIYDWSVAATSNDAVLPRISGTPGPTSTTTFVARALGSARVTSVGAPACYPQCLVASRLYYVSVNVVA